MWYLVAGVLTLKRTVSPGLTLIVVAKPWIVVEPDPVTCHSLAGFPGLLFSHAMTFVTGAAHGSAALAVGAPRASARSSVRAPAAATSKRPTGAAPLSAPAQGLPMASSFPWGSVPPPNEGSSAVDGESSSAPEQMARSARAAGVRYGDGVLMRKPVLQCNWRHVLSAARALAPGTGSRMTTSSAWPRRRLVRAVMAMSTPGGDVPPVTKGASRERPSGPRRTLPGTPWAGWPAVVLGVLFVAVTVLVVTGVPQSLDEWVIRSVRPHDVWGDSQVRISPGTFLASGGDRARAGLCLNGSPPGREARGRASRPARCFGLIGWQLSLGARGGRARVPRWLRAGARSGPAVVVAGPRGGRGADGRRARRQCHPLALRRRGRRPARARGSHGSPLGVDVEVE